MKRDMDLVRLILMKIEDKPNNRPEMEFNIDGYEAKEVLYHLTLLEEAKLIEGMHLSSRDGGGKVVHPTRLTWTGHEFMDASRDPTRWDQAKVAAAKAGGFGLDIFAKLLASMAMEAGKRAANL